jgi:death on curing protein
LLSDPNWIPLDALIRLNKKIVAETREPYGLISESGLDSACARPKHRNIYYPNSDIACLATYLLFGIARNHPFVQGNKRTGFYAMFGFLLLNGYILPKLDDESYGVAIMAVLERRATEEQFEQALRGVIRQVQKPT